MYDDYLSLYIYIIGTTTKEMNNINIECNIELIENGVVATLAVALPYPAFE